MHLLASSVVLSLLAQLGASLPSLSATSTPPDIPTGQAAKQALAALTVAPQGPETGYSRSLFPHWIIQHGECNTREVVLERDGTGVQVQDKPCRVTSGTWLSPYDASIQTNPAVLDIDHLVPLANAWRSGASSWTTPQRQKFANDLQHPQLLAVPRGLNRQKGDSGPEHWKPPLKSYHCTYASIWTRVKSVYGLTVTSDEKAALQEMLQTC